MYVDRRDLHIAGWGLLRAKTALAATDGEALATIAAEGLSLKPKRPYRSCLRVPEIDPVQPRRRAVDCVQVDPKADGLAT